jgi:hypothetical protein
MPAQQRDEPTHGDHFQVKFGTEYYSGAAPGDQ